MEDSFENSRSLLLIQYRIICYIGQRRALGWHYWLLLYESVVQTKFDRRLYVSCVLLKINGLALAMNELVRVEADGAIDVVRPRLPRAEPDTREFFHSRIRLGLDVVVEQEILHVFVFLERLRSAACFEGETGVIRLRIDSAAESVRIDSLDLLLISAVLLGVTYRRRYVDYFSRSKKRHGVVVVSADEKVGISVSIHVYAAAQRITESSQRHGSVLGVDDLRWYGDDSVLRAKINVNGSLSLVRRTYGVIK